MARSDPRPPADPPAASGPLVCRERELDRLGALLVRRARLVTLIGAGGIGKTTLAEEAVRRLRRARRTPVFIVRLADLPRDADAAAVREAVTSAVLIDGFVGASAWAGAVQRLSSTDASGRAGAAVLLVDNCEHALAGVGAVIVELLDAAPALTILATSREPIGWIDEQLVVVPPLSASHSLQVFRQRAEMAGHPITEPQEVAIAEQICGHLHGNPLFIALAAAHTTDGPLPQLLEQLSGDTDDTRMQWSGGPTTRHGSIGDTIAWSHEQCTPKERLLFDRLSVFAPGYAADPADPAPRVVDLGADLEAIEAVCADDVPAPGDDPAHLVAGALRDRPVRLHHTEIRGLVQRLMEQSLVSAHITADAVHYYLVESLRLFAADRLAARSTETNDETARLTARHYHYYRSKVQGAQVQWFGPAETRLLTWAVGARSNIQRAIDASVRTVDADVALHIALGLISFRVPFLSGPLAVLRGRIDQAMAADHARRDPSTEHQLTATALAAWLALIQGRPQDAEESLERCVAACDLQVPHEHWRDRPETDIGLPGVIDYAWGLELMWLRRDPRAITVLARARQKRQTAQNRGSTAMNEFYEALATGFFGSAEQALGTCRRHLDNAIAAGAEITTAWAQIALAIALTKHGDAREALQLGQAALAHQMPIADPWLLLWAVHVRTWSLARLLADQVASGNTTRRTLLAQAAEIAHLFGGVKAHQARLGITIENMGPFHDETSTAARIARQVLGGDRYAVAEQRGAALLTSPRDLKLFALGTRSMDASSDGAATTPTTAPWETLSQAEQEVAILAAAGWPNSAIAARRGTSTKTADAQIAAIFQKLTINSRADIIDWLPPDLNPRVSLERRATVSQNPDEH